MKEWMNDYIRNTTSRPTDDVTMSFTKCRYSPQRASSTERTLVAILFL